MILYRPVHWVHITDLYWPIIMPIFSTRNEHEPKLLIYFLERKIREKLLPNLLNEIDLKMTSGPIGAEAIFLDTLVAIFVLGLA